MLIELNRHRFEWRRRPQAGLEPTSINGACALFCYFSFSFFFFSLLRIFVFECAFIHASIDVSIIIFSLFHKGLFFSVLSSDGVYTDDTNQSRAAALCIPRSTAGRPSDMLPSSSPLASHPRARPTLTAGGLQVSTKPMVRGRRNLVAAFLVQFSHPTAHPRSRLGTNPPPGVSSGAASTS